MKDLKPDDPKLPWMPWYPDDFANDPNLRVCSLAAVGVWILLLGYMKKHSPQRGYAVMADGSVPSDHELAVFMARLMGRSYRGYAAGLVELSRAGVFSRDDRGAIFSRRIVREEQKKQARSEAGKKGAAARWDDRRSVPRTDPVDPDFAIEKVVAPSNSNYDSSDLNSEEGVQRESRTPLHRPPSRPPDPWTAQPVPEIDHTLADVFVAYEAERRGRMKPAEANNPAKYADAWRSTPRTLDAWREIFRRAAKSPLFRGDDGGWFADLLSCLNHADDLLAGRYDERRRGPKEETYQQPAKIVIKPYKNAPRADATEPKQ